MPSGGFKINRRGIQKMSREIEKEFAKNPITIPVQADGSPQPVSVVNHHAPVVYGGVSGSSVVWGDGQANLNQTSHAGSGQEELAAALTRILEQMPRDGLPAEDAEDLEDAGGQALEAARSPHHDEGRVKRGVRAILRILEPIAQGARAGASEGAQGWAREAMQSLPPL
ncbi:hypothetical protein [Nocardiopsis sp. L17-MgMaSL7]|uniref:hypothetical protein n=1 Tax=Nocardiopsis sp. L17-MgMaSL7 TaxID=1938893 RepID=UPI000D710D65|nr:hypothetical protein [Nocardiopsis sp. L17-MgMaSL7]PWV44584.1 hypothetical protein BDW27_12343 [Nocardiopsis sp. L17-MgMaSL7]